MKNRKSGLAKQLAMSSAYWVLNKSMVQVFGLESAMLLSNFAEADSMFTDSEDGWFYQTSETVEKVTTLSRHKQNKCIKILIDAGVLHQQNKGMPMKRYFRLDYDVLATLLADFQQTEVVLDKKDQFAENQQPTLLKTDNQLCQKSATIKNIDKEPNKESKYDDSLRSSSPTAEVVEGRVKALDKESKYANRDRKGEVDLNAVIAQASQKSIKARAEKPVKPNRTVQNANTIVKYFGEKFQETFGGVAPLELAKDRKLMKQMIEHYGYEEVSIAIDWMFRNWAKFRRECRITSVPTIGVFFGFRGYLQEQTAGKAVAQEREVSNEWGV